MHPLIYVATRKGLFELSRGKSGWSISAAHFLGDNVPMLFPDLRDGRLYAALNHGHFGSKMHRLDPGAKSWTEIAVPAYPPRPADLPPATTAMGSAEPQWKLNLIWSLESAGPDRPGALWCGTVPGGLFHSADNGATWELVRSLWDHPQRTQWFGGGMDIPGIHSICVDPRNSDHIRIAISCGGVWQTPDHARTWSYDGAGMRAQYMPPERQFDPLIQDPHRMVQSPSHPDCLWVQHHNGIFRSTDGARNWTEISAPPAAPSAFGFAVAVHPADPKTAWFAPAIKDEKRIPPDGKVVISRTRDAGQSFQVLRDGLPQDHAYDLTLRHALDVDSTGQVLAFGSTTGSLWTTEDGGDHWTRLPNNLPPIYCVRIRR